MARELSDKHKVSFRSLPELVESFAALAMRLKSRGLAVPGARQGLSREGLGNALVCWVAALPAEEQERVVRVGLALFAERLGAAGPDGGGVPAPGPGLDVGFVSGPAPASPRRRGGRRA